MSRVGMVEVTVTPDGMQYLAAARGEKTPKPFCLRWLAPLICRESVHRWLLCSKLSLTAFTIGVVVLARGYGASWGASIAAGALVVLLPSTRTYLSWPVLVDPPALALAVWCAVLIHAGLWPYAIPLALLSGCIKETGPIWASVYSFNPIPLVGMIPVGLRWLATRDAENVGNPPSFEYHSKRWRHPVAMVTPWGGLAAAVFWPSWWLGLALVVGYAQLFVASDMVRLYQQAAPVAAVVVAVHCPVLLPLVLLSWFNPWPGNGV